MSEVKAEYQLAVTTYAAVGALAVLIWDILDHVYDDCGLLLLSRRKGFKLASVVYLVSRIAALSYALSSAVFWTAPLGHCEMFCKVVNAWCPLALASSAYLFFLRLRAVYSREKVIVAIFFFFWVGLLAAVIFVPFAISGGPSGSTEYCRYSSLAKYAPIAQIGPLAYDTLVFLAISWKLSHNSPSSNVNAGESLKAIVFGRNLPVFTKMLLRDGQLYYLITLMAGMTAVILTYHPGVPSPLKALANDPYLALVNIMACRVYRRTATGVSQPAMIRMNRTKSSRPIIIRSTASAEMSDTGEISKATASMDAIC